MTDENSTKFHEIPAITLQTAYVVKTKEMVEQKRTKVKKGLFLDMFSRSLGIITTACEKAGIDRKTYYNWIRDDAEFKDSVANTERDRTSEVRDRLYEKIMKKDGASIRFYLERKDPSFKLRTAHEIEPGTGKSLEQALEDYAIKLIEEEDGQSKDTKKDADKPADNRVDVSDQKQTGSEDAVQTERSTKTVLGEKDPKKPDTQSPPKRA